MVDLQNVAVSRRPAYSFDPNVLQVKPDFNARGFTDPENLEHVENLAHVEDIAQSMRDNGFDTSQPIAIFTEGDNVYIANGIRRWRAALLAGITLVTCIPVSSKLSKADLILGQNRANSAKRFTPLEEALNFARARDLGVSVDDIAKRTGRSASHVRNWLKLHDSPDEVKQMVADGTIAAKLAIEAEPEAIADAVKAAEAVGQTRVTAKDVTPREPSERKQSALAFVKKLAKRKDPLSSDNDFDDEIRAFAEFVAEAKEIARS